jgi:hypothetical protein
MRSDIDPWAYALGVRACGGVSQHKMAEWADTLRRCRTPLMSQHAYLLMVGTPRHRPPLRIGHAAPR